MISCSFRVRRVMISIASVAGAAPLLALRCEMDPSSSFLLFVAHERGSGSKRTTATERSSPSRRKPRLGMLFLLSLLRSSLASIVRCLVLPPSLPPSLRLSSSPLPPLLPFPILCGLWTDRRRERKKEGRKEGWKEDGSALRTCHVPSAVEKEKGGRKRLRLTDGRTDVGPRVTTRYGRTTGEREAKLQRRPSIPYIDPSIHSVAHSSFDPSERPPNRPSASVRPSVRLPPLLSFPPLLRPILSVRNADKAGLLRSADRLQSESEEDDEEDDDGATPAAVRPSVPTSLPPSIARADGWTDGRTGGRGR